MLLSFPGTDLQQLSEAEEWGYVSPQMLQSSYVRIYMKRMGLVPIKILNTVTDFNEGFKQTGCGQC